MVSVILDFIKWVWSFIYLSLLLQRATKAHTGAYLAACIAECLREYGIDDKVWSDLDLWYQAPTFTDLPFSKVLTFIADNASNNDMLIDELSNLIPTFSSTSCSPTSTTQFFWVKPCHKHCLVLSWLSKTE